MNGLKSIWASAVDNRSASLGASAGMIVLGVLIVAVGEMQALGWTRLVGAGVISAFSVVFGTLIGWSEPLRPRLAALLSNWRRAIVLFLALVMVAPLLAGLLLGFGGLIIGGHEADRTLLLAGVLITVALLVLISLTVATGILLAVQSPGRSEPDHAAGSNGRGNR